MGLKQNLAVFNVVLLVLLAGALSQIHDEEKPKSSSTLLRSSENSTQDHQWKRAVLNTADAVHPNPDEVVTMVEMAIRNSSSSMRRSLRSSGRRRQCLTGNPIDDCWRCDPNWHKRRKRLADCAVGFGKNALGGRHGKFYMVTDDSDPDAVYPPFGTLRHAVIQDKPLWIVFKRNMVITLKQELLINSFKTIDARGVDVRIANGGCLTLQFVTNVIIHGLKIYNCKPTGNALVRSSPSHYGWRTIADGDAISIFGSSKIWIDHNTLSNCADGLVDAIMGSTALTISNNLMTHHNEVMLMGHSDAYTQDRIMQVTIAFNHFGEGLIQRMPRCRHGYFHVVNNAYTHWKMYAIGGSGQPTIKSQANIFDASNSRDLKEVTKRVDTVQSQWLKWNWLSEGDLFLNGAYFTESGDTSDSNAYARASSTGAMPSSFVYQITAGAGSLLCKRGHTC